MTRNPSWMRTALQTSEAVLLPALLPQRTDPVWRQLQEETENISPFVTTAIDDPQSETQALSTYVRSRGSMAGRSVLRAVGRTNTPVGMSTYQRPQYYAKTSKSTPIRSGYRYS